MGETNASFPKPSGTNEPVSITNLQSRISSTELSVLAVAKSDPLQSVKQGMLAHPELGDFVTKRMSEALTPEEQQLIAATALTVYYISRELPFKKTSQVQAEDPLVPLRTLIMVEEDEIALRKKDKNSIYATLQENLKDQPELAAYVAKKMSESVSLEEANLVGETALTTYNVVKFLGENEGI